VSAGVYVVSQVRSHHVHTDSIPVTDGDTMHSMDTRTSGHRPAFCRLWLLDDSKYIADTQHSTCLAGVAPCVAAWTAVHTQE
jgi:hypothetical protein